MIRASLSKWERGCLQNPVVDSQHCAVHAVCTVEICTVVWSAQYGQSEHRTAGAITVDTAIHIMIALARPSRVPRRLRDISAAQHSSRACTLQVSALFVPRRLDLQADYVGRSSWLYRLSRLYRLISPPLRQTERQLLFAIRVLQYNMMPGSHQYRNEG